MSHCLRHYEEPVAATCRACHNPFCSRCLVYSFGAGKPPFCVSCALHASGVRTGASRVPVAAAPVPVGAGSVGDQFAAAAPDKRLERAYRRAERTAQKQATKAARKAQRTAGPPQALAMADAGAPSSRVPAPSSLVGHDVGVGTSF